jgi:hypothetical protein
LGKSWTYFRVLNWASLLSGIPDNSDYAERVVMPSAGPGPRVRAGWGAGIG